MKIILRTFALFLLMLFAAHVSAEAEEYNFPEPPYSVEQLGAWHKSMEPWPWLGSPEVEVHLRNEDGHELLLAVAGYARGGTYILFAEQDGVWAQISDKIDQAHHPLHILEAENEGWHDFEAFSPLWRGGDEEVWVTTYSWDGAKYALIKSETGRWCDYYPFKGAISLCPASKPIE